MPRKLRIIVSGMVAGDPGQGGASWAVLQYVIGLMDLGHTVVLIEPVAQKKLSDSGVPINQSKQANYLRQIALHFDLRDQLAMVVEESRESIGISFEALRRFAGECDLLINISGMLVNEELVSQIPVRVYLDLDPAFNQLWHSQHGIDMGFDEHTHHFTVGLGLGTPDCPVPTCGIEWRKMMPPVVLRLWPGAQNIRHDALTSVANFRGYGSVDYRGQQYGQKVHSLRNFYPLPTLTSEKIFMAMQVDPMESKDLEAMAAHGWKLLDPTIYCSTPWNYQEFLQGSKAEFGLAKSGYVKSNSGWFSDRSACYLASGRPVIAQATGFERHLPVGNGLLSFQTCDDALMAIDSLNSRYDEHARAARALAVEHFDSSKVLKALMDAVGF